MTMASLSNIKFWSAFPPRTLKPVAASPAEEIPGNMVAALRIFCSPKTKGMFLVSMSERLLFPSISLSTFWFS